MQFLLEVRCAQFVVLAVFVLPGCLVSLENAIAPTIVSDDADSVETGDVETDASDATAGVDIADADDDVLDAVDMGVVDDATVDTDGSVDSDNEVVATDVDGRADGNGGDASDALDGEGMPIFCDDLDCNAQGRVCDEGSLEPVLNARCGDCASGYHVDGEFCVLDDCSLDIECTPDSTIGEWGNCGEYVDVCDQIGERSRERYAGRCASGVCTVDIAVESEACPEARETDDVVCVQGEGSGECLDGRCILSLGEECTDEGDCGADSRCGSTSVGLRCLPQPFDETSDAMEFVLVPAGTFTQGTAGSESDERPYEATLTRDIFVASTEVTQGQWMRATDGVNAACFQTTEGIICDVGDNTSDHPVERVSWYAAAAYANWLSEEHGLSSCYSLQETGCGDSVGEWADGDLQCAGAVFAGLDCEGYRLLVEAEWEYAARAGSTGVYPWGDASDSVTMGLFAWYSETAGRRTHPVAGLLPNDFGLFDVVGNVAEWVWDRYAPNYPSVPVSDYVGPAAGQGRVWRGGAWGMEAGPVRSTTRDFDLPQQRSGAVGFRLARTVLR